MSYVPTLNQLDRTMKYVNDEWTIKKLIEVYETDNLILNPPYQRNPVWNLRAQQILIDTILSEQPMPNFFFLKQTGNKYEIVDGQQRVRTILGFFKNLIPSWENKLLKNLIQENPAINEIFSEYRISVCILSELLPQENIEQFYAKVNSTGLRLNRPELKKAEYFSTNFLKLLQELTQLPELESLRLFSSLTSSRLNDLDFISELVALLKFGITDKKEKVDELYEDDISNNDFSNLFEAFKKILSILNKFEHIQPIRRTRYKQKNDFYTLFYFIHKNINLSIDNLEYFYQILVKLGPHIKPSQEKCIPLKNYAINCVTQSNSKKARIERYKILEQVLLNSERQPNEVQFYIIRFFKMTEPYLCKIADFYTLNHASIEYLEQSEFKFDNEI